MFIYHLIEGIFVIYLFPEKDEVKKFFGVFNNLMISFMVKKY